MDKIILLCLLLCSSLLVTESHLLPDELLTDDAEQLEREKRDGFFERLFKTFPLFKHEESEEEQQSEKVQDVIDDDDVADSFVGSYQLPELDVRGGDILATPSLVQDSTRSENMFTVPTSNSQSSTNSESTHVIVSSSMIQNLSSVMSFASTSNTINSSAEIIMLNTSSAAISTQGFPAHTSVPKPTMSFDIQPTPLQSMQLSTSYSKPTRNGPFYDVEMLLTPKLPDEREYANILGNSLETVLEFSTIQKNILNNKYIAYMPK